MFELIGAGGWLMLPIIICSIISLTIVIERAWVLRRENILPSKLHKELSNPTTSIILEKSIVSLGIILSLASFSSRLSQKKMTDTMQCAFLQKMRRVSLSMNC